MIRRLALAQTMMLYLWAAARASEPICTPVGDLQANCYLLADPGGAGVLLIDPGGEAGIIKALLAKQKLPLLGILATHAHPDHLDAAGEIQRSTGVNVYIFTDDLAEAQSQYPKVRFTAIPKAGPLRIGPFDMEIIPTPGHTPGSICILWHAWLFTGDTLFFQAIGKTDRPQSLARQIRTKLLSLSGATIIHPGHGPATTIAFEQRSNPLLTGSDPWTGADTRWLEDDIEAQRQARREGKMLVLLLTVASWPCAQGYCAELAKDPAIGAFLKKTVNCRIELPAHQEYLKQFELCLTPQDVPALVIMDSRGAVLDTLKKLSADSVRETMQQLDQGARPYPEFLARERKTDKTPQDYLELARYLIRHNQLQRAAFCLERGLDTATAAEPSRGALEELLLKCEVELGDDDDALVLAERILADAGLKEETRAATLLKKCRIYYQKKDYQAGIALLKKFIAAYGDRYAPGPALLMLGLCHLGRADYQKARDAFTKAGAGALPDVAAQALYLRGYCHLVQQDYARAREDFSALARDFPLSEYTGQAESFLAKLADVQH